MIKFPTKLFVVRDSLSSNILSFWAIQDEDGWFKNFAFTRWGAIRIAKRLLRRYKEAQLPFEVTLDD